MTFSGAGGEPARPSAIEPCESCGTPVQLIDTGAIMRAVFDHYGFSADALAAAAGGPTFHEAHQTSGPSSMTLATRPHTPERCRAVRDGNPEPWEPMTFDDEDDE